MGNPRAIKEEAIRNDIALEETNIEARWLVQYGIYWAKEE